MFDILDSAIRNPWPVQCGANFTGPSSAFEYATFFMDDTCMFGKLKDKDLTPSLARGILTGFSFHFLFNHPISDFFKFSAREDEGSHPVKKYSNSPPHKGPDKPEILRRGEEVNDDKQNIHPNIDSQMDIKSNLGLHAPPCSLVSLFVFHNPLLIDSYA
jgi:hypothetical protein